MPDQLCLDLHFPNFLRVAGETLQGHVNVNVPGALEDKVENVYIKLRGSIVTRITERQHQGVGAQARTVTHHHTQTVELVRSNQMLWDHTQGSQQTIQCPFQLQLPPALPPSFHLEQGDHVCTISYSLEVVGKRHGMFHADRRIRRLFSVVPAAAPNELQIAGMMKQGWPGPWKPFTTRKEIRHGILFGDYSEAAIEFVIPDVPTLPMGVPIPFAFHVWTKTKTVDQDALAEKGDKLFPAPPRTPDQVECKLIRRGRMRAHAKNGSFHSEVTVPGCVGDKHAVSATRVTFDQPEFVPLPNRSDKGIWKRAGHFDGRMVVAEPPTFSSATVDWHYAFEVKMDFPGIGNILELNIPIHINSGIAPPGLPHAGYQSNYSPPPINLAQGYWDGTHHAWDEEN